MANRIDSFNRADSASSLGTPSDAGSAWSALEGVFGIASNKAFCASHSTFDHAAVLESSAADADVQFTASGMGGGDGIELVFRAVDQDNFFLLFIGSGISQVILRDRVAGINNMIGTWSGSLADGDVYKASFVGSAIRIYRNGTQIIPSSGTITSSSRLTATKHGIGAYGSNANARFEDFSITDAGADVTVPVLTTPVGTTTGSTTATIGATTDEGNGTLYGVVTTSSTPPTATQIKAGQNNGGTSAVFAGTTSVGSTGARTISATGLTASTAYYAHLVHTDAASNNSNVVTSAQFTTNAGPLVSGTTSFLASGPAGISVVASATSGGTGTLSYQWERNASGGSYSDLSGATSLSLTDATATPGTLYGYRCKQTRGAETVTTNAVTAQVYSGGALTAAGRARIIGG